MEPTVRVVNSLVPNWAVAVSLPGDTILVKRGWETYPGVIEHEKVHLEQYHRYGTIGFLTRYFILATAGMLKAGSTDPTKWYRYHPFEVEAIRRSGFPEGLLD